MQNSNHRNQHFVERKIRAQKISQDIFQESVDNTKYSSDVNLIDDTPHQIQLDPGTYDIKFSIAKHASQNPVLPTDKRRP